MKTKTFAGREKALIIGIIFAVAVVIVSATIAMLGMVTLPSTPPKGAETEKVNYSNFTTLIEDFNDLPEIKDGIDLKERNAKEKILVLLRSDDPEIEKAFDLNSNACATYILSYISLNSVLMRYLH